MMGICPGNPSQLTPGAGGETASLPPSLLQGKAPLRSLGDLSLAKTPLMGRLQDSEAGPAATPASAGRSRAEELAAEGAERLAGMSWWDQLQAAERQRQQEVDAKVASLASCSGRDLPVPGTAPLGAHVLRQVESILRPLDTGILEREDAGPSESPRPRSGEYLDDLLPSPEHDDLSAVDVRPLVGTHHPTRECCVACADVALADVMWPRASAGRRRPGGSAGMEQSRLLSPCQGAACRTWVKRRASPVRTLLP